MKELVRSHLTVLINDIKAEMEESQREYISGVRISSRLNNILDYLMDVKEGNEAITLISRSEYEHYLELQKRYEEDEF